LLIDSHEVLRTNLRADDGSIGVASDLLFDDVEWVVRYVDVETGEWSKGRRAIISPLEIHWSERDARGVPIGLSRERLKDSPQPARRERVSRQHESLLAGCFLWPTYWEDYAFEIVEPELRSALQLFDCRVLEEDQEVGRPVSMFIDDEVWQIRRLVVDGGRKVEGRKVILIPPEWIVEADWGGGVLRIEANTAVAHACSWGVAADDAS
jgi:hypothetical protein